MIRPRVIKKLFLLAIVLAFLLSMPVWASSFLLRLATVSLFFSLSVLSFNFLAGQLGLTSLMQGTLVGISAYIVAILQVKYRLGFPIPELTAVSLTASLAAVLGVGLIRTRGVYFLVLTMVIGLAFWALAVQWVEMSGGTTGIIGVRAPILFGVNLRSPIPFYYCVLTFALLFYVAFWFLCRSRYGLVLRGIRENERRMRSLGYNVRLIIWISLVLSSLPAAFNGVFLAYDLGVMNPHQMTLTTNVYVLLAGIMGGAESIVGALLGAFGLKTLDIYVAAWTERYLLFTGVVFVLVVLFRQQVISMVRKALASLLDSLRRFGKVFY